MPGPRRAAVASAPLPRAELPVPILPAHPEWVELYWRAWELAWQHVRASRPGSGFVRRYLDEAFSDHLFQWDTCFMVFFARYAPHLFPGVESLENFYLKQHPDGFICRELEADGRDSFRPASRQAINPPLFAWAEWGYYRTSGDASRLSTVLPKLTAYYQWIKRHRRRPGGLYWTSPLGAGMDNSPRQAYAWIDLSAQQALAALHLARMAEAIGEGKAAEEYRREYIELGEVINHLTWDDATGMYLDLDRSGRHTRVKTLASIWPLVAEIAHRDRAEAMLEHLTHPAEFWRPHVFPTLSADHPLYHSVGDYWRGGVWAPTNYAAIKGLELYGHHELARRAAENHIENMAQVLRRTGTIWENYAPEATEPGNRAKPDFVGWSGLGPIALLIENVLGLEVVAPANAVRWRIVGAEERGIKNLLLAGQRVSLRAAARPDEEAPLLIEVDAEREFVLDLDSPLGTARRKLPAGTHQLVWEPGT